MPLFLSVYLTPILRDGVICVLLFCRGHLRGERRGQEEGEGRRKHSAVPSPWDRDRTCLRELCSPSPTVHGVPAGRREFERIAERKHGGGVAQSPPFQEED